ncbi:[Fe-Fe] hydrogenase large subunit C-terminal domain-containing protein [Marinitoga sp. 1138]|uniref:[Fe-Fe] hydrogenase large subunit C-terminal domain-containing protein n=1 Tax=Marinitoga sp. 1138 TaxID=1643334 RepID=UPI001585D708|nr:[Fe-Fe] hydrogenase large subunit C-terminal domain-containing protein [Marinitoga sp. 1138]NUU97463.1 hypothetical protein [Marinitoga sp. 1138]
MNGNIIYTEPEKCTLCYNCIRVCPVHANKVYDDYVEPDSDLCIKCGQCILSCESQARRYRKDIDIFEDFKNKNEYLVAIIAPAYVGDLENTTPNQYAAALKKLGFNEVHEVAFGAELTTLEVLKEMEEKKPEYVIMSPCPSLINYLEKWQPDLLQYFSESYSPMLSTAAFVKKEKPNAKVVFISPCTAKKSEIEHESIKGLVDIVLTFEEINELFEKNNIKPSMLEEELFDGYQPNYATLFPVSGGLTKTAASYLKNKKIDDIMLEEDVLVIEGKERSIPFFKDFEKNIKAGKKDVTPKFIDILFCEGCIDGPATRKDIPLFEKRAKIIKYTKDRLVKNKFLTKDGKQVAQKTISLKDTKKIYEEMNLKRYFKAKPVNYKEPPESFIVKILEKTNRLNDERNCTACGYETCRERAKAVYNGLMPEDLCIIYIMEEAEELLDKIRKQRAKSNEMLESVSSILSEVSVVVDEVTEQAVSLNTKAEEITEISIKGKDVVSELEGKNNIIENNIGDITEKLNRLTDKTKQLVPILDMINKIANQTGLLALNASIEAARVGEAGKGFSVIAVEISELANTTKEYSNNINETINEMKEVVEMVNQGIGNMIEQIKDESSMVQNTTDQFEKINEKINILSEDIQKVSASAEEMNASVNEMETTIKKILKSSVEE